jgi:ABC-type transport system involved in cytochrome bd biosynthesis fused ATPase/permease subunit
MSGELAAGRPRFRWIRLAGVLGVAWLAALATLGITGLIAPFVDTTLRAWQAEWICLGVGVAAAAVWTRRQWQSWLAEDVVDHASARASSPASATPAP